MSEHRVGVNPGFLAKHTLNLAGLSTAEGRLLVEELDELPGVDGVWLNEEKGRLKIAYDASKHNIDEVIACINRHGASLKAGWWDRLKLDWQRQTDQNLKDNANYKPHCCSKDPSGGHH